MLSLRHLRRSDSPRLRVLLDNDHIRRNICSHIPSPFHERDALDYIDAALTQDDQHVYAILAEGELIGRLVLKQGCGVYTRSLEMGYWIGELYWGQGYATSAVQLALELAWNMPDIARVYAAVIEYNPASMRVLEKCGFQKEGIARKATYKDGTLYDEHRFAILKPR